MSGLPKIKYTGPEFMPRLFSGRVYSVGGASERPDGSKVLFIHVEGNWIGVDADQCEEIAEGENTE